jgi:hypothetical protein
MRACVGCDSARDISCTQRTSPTGCTRQINRSSECGGTSVYGGRMWHIVFSSTYDDANVISRKWMWSIVVYNEEIP